MCVRERGAAASGREMTGDSADAIASFCPWRENSRMFSKTSRSLHSCVGIHYGCSNPVEIGAGKSASARWAAAGARGRRKRGGNRFLLSWCEWCPQLAPYHPRPRPILRRGQLSYQVAPATNPLSGRGMIGSFFSASTCPRTLSWRLPISSSAPLCGRCIPLSSPFFCTLCLPSQPIQRPSVRVLWGQILRHVRIRENIGHKLVITNEMDMWEIDVFGRSGSGLRVRMRSGANRTRAPHSLKNVPGWNLSCH